MTLSVYILAGGKSERFGSDKAYLEIDGEANWQRIAAAFEDVTLLEGASDRLSDIPLRRLADVVPDAGPMGGLLTALQDANQRGMDKVGLISVDMVGWQPAWLESLAENCETANAYHDELWQPLFAVYHVSIETIVRARIQSGELAMWRLLESIGAKRQALPQGWSTFRSINTPSR